MLPLPNVKKSEGATVKVIIADDHPMMRQAIRIWLEKNEDIKVIAEARNGWEALEIATRLSPDVVIMDISMPKLNGLEATSQIVSRCPNTKVLVLTVHTDSEHIRSMLQAGASGYLTKDVPGEEVVHAVREVMAGEQVIQANTSEDDEKIFNNAPQVQHPSLIDLTPRELKILKFIANGLHNKDIAGKMGISLRGVKAILTIVYIKLGASSRTEAVSIGLKSGILSLDDLKTFNIL